MNIPFPSIPLIDHIDLGNNNIDVNIDVNKLYHLYFTPNNLYYIYDKKLYIDPEIFITKYPKLVELLFYLEAKYNRSDVRYVSSRDIFQDYLYLNLLPPLEDVNRECSTILSTILEQIRSSELTNSEEIMEFTNQHCRNDDIFYYGTYKGNIVVAKNKRFFIFKPSYPNLLSTFNGYYRLHNFELYPQEDICRNLCRHSLNVYLDNNNVHRPICITPFLIVIIILSIYLDRPLTDLNVSNKRALEWKLEEFFNNSYQDLIEWTFR